MAKSTLLIEMLQMLQRRPGMTIDELARSLGRSQRTIYRWLNEIAADLRVPVQCRDGGYYLFGETSASPTDLSAEELLAVRLSLRLSPFPEGSPIRRHADSAWMKIRNRTARAAGFGGDAEALEPDHARRRALKHALRMVENCGPGGKNTDECK